MKIEQQIQRKIDELNALKARASKKQTQQKIIVASVILNACEHDENLSSLICNVLLDKTSSRDMNKISEIVDKLNNNSKNY